eukprot:TRINITY_DN613_c0_g1_i12.p1 TRINITY_DN613_c0_g1~~TRINITY_DN613_c0_g1_i12.p1  ORF type:complete len:146 (-),score=28.00 TRINITY_DN613_c0_g1_i12:27-464(-)
MELRKWIRNQDIDWSQQLGKICSNKFLATMMLDSKYIVSGGDDKTIKSVAISSDNKFIVSGSGDKTIKIIWNLESGQEIKTLTGHNDAHSKSVNSVAISSDNKYIVSGSDDNTIKIIHCFRKWRQNHQNLEFRKWIRNQDIDWPQ